MPMTIDKSPGCATNIFALSTKIILVNGDIRKATEQLDTRIYFDQEGVLSQKFALTAVPAAVHTQLMASACRSIPTRWSRRHDLPHYADPAAVCSSQQPRSRFCSRMRRPFCQPHHRHLLGMSVFRSPLEASRSPPDQHPIPATPRCPSKSARWGFFTVLALPSVTGSQWPLRM